MLDGDQTEDLIKDGGLLVWLVLGDRIEWPLLPCDTQDALLRWMNLFGRTSPMSIAHLSYGG